MQNKCWSMCEQPFSSRVIMEHKLNENSKPRFLIEIFNLSEFAVINVLDFGQRGIKSLL